MNFGGKGNELWTEGGEKQFIINMIKQSAPFAKSCYWFSALVSKKETLDFIYDTFYKLKISTHKTIPMGQGNKISRIVAWTFLTNEEERNWMKERWQNE